MEKIAVIGAAGRTGQAVVKRALAEGYEVHAFARRPMDSDLQHPLLTWFQGDVLNQSALLPALSGVRQVISVFGQVKGSPPWVQTEGTRNLVELMQSQGISRLVSLSGGGLSNPTYDRPGVRDRLVVGLMRLFVPQVLRDAEGHKKILDPCDLDWMIVRAPRLTLSPGKGKYREGFVGVGTGFQLSREDLARYICDQLRKEVLGRTLPMVSE
jgi:putative NADH-flavin reductase